MFNGQELHNSNYNAVTTLTKNSLISSFVCIGLNSSMSILPHLFEYRK